MHSVRPGKEGLSARCPICDEQTAPRSDNRSFPFCTERCQLVDLSRWLDGDYSIPGEPADVSLVLDD